MTTESTQNPTPTGGASMPADPIDRLEAYLAASDDDSTGQPADTAAQADDDGDEAQDAAKPTDKPADDAQAKDSEPQITTAQLAAFLGVEESDIDVDADGQPVFKTKIDGKESTAKFADLRKTYQLGAHAENQMRAAAEAKKAADARLQEVNQAAQAKFQQIDATLQQSHEMAAVMAEDLRAEYQAQPWDELWRQDPAQARALERRFEQKNARIQGMFQTITQRRQQVAQAARLEQSQAAKVQADADQAALDAERSRMTELIPEWRDQQTAAKEMQELTAWALKVGYSQDELKAMSKAHHVAALRMAWQNATLKASKPAVENKVRSAPKLVKPGTQPAIDGPAANLRNLKQQVKNASGGKATDAVAAYLLASGKA